MSAASTTATWPEMVWDVPMLRGLDARGRREIEAAGTLRRLASGEILFAPGDPADVLHVVTSGSVVLAGARHGEDGASVVRRAIAGEVVGEDAIVASFAMRRLEARCEADAVVAAVPVAVLERVASRAGGAELLAKLQRALRRTATLDVLRTTVSGAVTSEDLELLVDVARHVHVGRGEHLYREGDVAADAFLVVDGLLQAQTKEEGRPRIEAYFGPRDFFGDEELATRELRPVAVVANGPTWLVAFPRDAFLSAARRNASLIERVRRLRTDTASTMRVRAGAHTTAHVFQDLYRLRVARSLLVIDQDSCIRCGHCAWSCADAHSDGVSRLIRRGDKIIVSDAPEPAPLLVPNSCQHCKNPSCMIGCPTGAIGRDARGEVFIREDLCTGCGSCAKACPWDNIQLAPRSDAKDYPAVAVKCDLCKGRDGGPACVAACPTQSIARINPNDALVAQSGFGKSAPTADRTLVELRVPRKAAAASPILPRRTPAWPWVLGATLAAAGLASTTNAARWTSGAVAGAIVALLVLYAVAKRGRGPLARLRGLRGRVPDARVLYIAHLALGLIGCGVVAMHVGGPIPANGAGALTLTLAMAAATGVLGGIFGAFLPRALSRIERSSVLPEELGARRAALDEKIFTSLSGRSELVKTLFAKALKPYRASRLGPWTLLLSRRTLREEERAVRQRIDALTSGKSGSSIAGIDELVRLVVEHRAVRAQRLLTWALRGWLVPHLAASAATVVLLVLHVMTVSAR